MGKIAEKLEIRHDLSFEMMQDDEDGWMTKMFNKIDKKYIRPVFCK